MANVTTASFPAMGTTCEVTIVGGSAELADRAAARVDELEGRWSRFRADSEISRLNARAGTATALSPDSYLLVDRAIAGWRWTGGLYDPTVLRSLEAAGYDRSFEHVRGGTRPPARHERAPGCSAIVVDPALRAVTLPPGVGLDPGGVGKGLAADLVVALLMGEGAYGACVNLGGDGRIAGEAPPGGWRVGVGDPHDATAVLGVLSVEDAGVATSSRLMRRWRAGGAEVHHLLDPRTGKPVDNGIDTVTVVEREAWFADVLSKAVFVAGPDAGGTLLARSGAAGVVVHEDGRVSPLGTLRMAESEFAPAHVACVPK